MARNRLGKDKHWKQCELEGELLYKMKELTGKKLGRNQSKYSKKRDGGLSKIKGRISYK